MIRGRWTLLCALFVALLSAGSAHGAVGTLDQKDGTAGCIAEVGGACDDGRGLVGAYGVVVSPDGENAYSVAITSDAVTTYDRNQSTGALSQKTGGDGCITWMTTTGCVSTEGLDGAMAIAVSPDGRHIYVASGASDAVVTLDRNPTTGALTPRAGAAGCVSSLLGSCTPGVALDGADAITVSPDGANVYVTGENSNSVAVFDRNATTGVLTQKTDTAGCVSETGAGPCADGRGLGRPFSVTVSPDGKNVYVAGHASDSVAIFERTSGGALTQSAGAAGCVVSAVAPPDCAPARAMDGPSSVAISPDGKSAYVASFNSGALTIFDRDAGTGGLTLHTGIDACKSNVTGNCTPAPGLSGARWVAVPADGMNVYAAAQGTDSVAIFDRNTTDGTLRQKDSPFGCFYNIGQNLCADANSIDGATALGLSPDGTSLYVAARDSSALAIFDRDAPPVTSVSGPTGLITDDTPTFTFSSSDLGSTFECRFDAQAFGACSGPGASHTPAPLTDGAHTFEVRATDPSGNADLTPASQSFWVDATAPRTTIDSGPAGITDDNTPTFEFSSDEPGVTFECRLDGGQLGPCSGPGNSHTSFALADGPHIFVVRATDPAGNVELSPPARSFTVDTTVPPADATPPETKITSAVKKRLRTSKEFKKVKIAFESEPAATFECRFDQGDFAPCVSPYKPKASSGPGKGAKHKVEILATDAAGNVEIKPARAKFRLIQTG